MGESTGRKDWREIPLLYQGREGNGIANCYKLLLAIVWKPLTERVLLLPIRDGHPHKLLVWK